MQEPETTPDLDATELIEQIFELWVQPEIERKRLSLAPEHVVKALVVMPPDRPTAVLLNDEARLVVQVRATGPVREGEQVTLHDYDDLKGLSPADVDPDAGWVCFARIGNNTYVAFDFRRNRDRARRLLDRAEEFLAVARIALGSGYRGPAVENGFAAAELAVVSQMLVMNDDAAREHIARRRWWSEWSKLGNAPTDQSRALAALAAKRGAARYAEKSLRIRSAYLQRLLNVVQEMVETARDSVGDPLPRY
jgi:HEPN domain-containing protein